MRTIISAVLIAVMALSNCTLGHARPDIAEVAAVTHAPAEIIKAASNTGTGAPLRTTPYQGKYTGYGPGHSTIGVDGDYPSLFEATQDLSRFSLTGGDWDFIILNDLTEPNNSLIGQSNTNGHTVTFRPAPGTQPTITFTTTTHTLGGDTWVGHILIGGRFVYTPFLGTQHQPTHNITFDGSSSPSGTDRSLTFRTVQNQAASVLLQVLGDCDHITIKNCRFDYRGYTGLYTPDKPGIVDFVGENYRGIGEGGIPDYGSVINCEIMSIGAGNAGGISYNTRVTYNSDVTGLLRSQGVRLQDNIIRTQLYGITVGSASDPIIAGNTIDITNRPNISINEIAGILCNGITDISGTGTMATIAGNTIRFLPTNPIPSPLYGIKVTSRYHVSHFLVANNMISGLTAPPAGFEYFGRYGIWHNPDATSSATLVHNSIAFHDAPVSAATTATRTAAIYTGGPNLPSKGPTILRNNIIRMGVPGAAAISGPNLQDRIFSNHNNLFVTSGSLVAYNNGTAYPLLTDWQNANGQDFQSIQLDPLQTAGLTSGNWAGPIGAWNPDMHFTAFPNPEYLAPPLSGVDYDVDGEPRLGPQVLMGADEIAPPAAAVPSWNLY